VDHHGSGVNPAVAGVAVDERRALRGNTEQLADERVSLAVAVLVDVEERLGK